MSIERGKIKPHFHLILITDDIVTARQNNALPTCDDIKFTQKQHK
jgi:hypothetical protein